MNASAARQKLHTRLSAAELRSRWQRMLRDPMLADVPGKLELNEKGTIELTPPNTRHSILQAFVARELHRIRPDGTAMTECAVETDIGVRVPDVAWASAAFMRRHGTESPLPKAPELCIEVLSPSNTRPEIQQKTAAYLAAGAIEVWLVAEDGTVEMLDERGRVEKSSLGIALGPPPL
jgi:Uma2 family endonuclease